MNHSTIGQIVLHSDVVKGTPVTPGSAEILSPLYPKAPVTTDTNIVFRGLWKNLGLGKEAPLEYMMLRLLESGK